MRRFGFILILAAMAHSANAATWWNWWTTNVPGTFVRGANNIGITNDSGSDWRFFGSTEATVARLIDVTNIVAAGGGGGGGSATNAVATVKTNGTTQSSAATSLNLISGSGLALRGTNTAGAVDTEFRVDWTQTFSQTNGTGLSNVLRALIDARSVADSNLSYSIGTDATNFTLAASNSVRLVAGLAATNQANADSVAASNLSYSIGTDGTNFALAASNSVRLVAGLASTNLSKTLQIGDAALTNLAGTVGKNVTNIVSLSTSNATSKPLSNSYTSGVLTLFGLEAGSGATITPNGSNLVIAATGSDSSNHVVEAFGNITVTNTATVGTLSANTIQGTNALNLYGSGGGSFYLGASNALGGMVINPQHNLPVVITNIYAFSNAAPGQAMVVISSNNNTVTWGISNVAATATGTSDVESNIIVSATNNVILDFSAANVFRLTLLTNWSETYSNVTKLTNWANHHAMVYYQQDTNGQRALNYYSVDGGLRQTNANQTPTTNANGLDVLEVIPSFFKTNVLTYWPQNFQPRVAVTNSLASGGGGGGGGGGNFVLVTNGTAGGNLTTVTTTAADTSGSSLIVVSLGFYNGIGTPPLTDSKGNTWTKLTTKGGTGAVYSNVLFYCVNPTVGSGHTFTGTAAYPNVSFLAFSGGTPAFESESGAAGHNFTTIQPGSITPAQNNEVLVTGITWQSGGTAAIDSSFTAAAQSLNGAGTLYSGIGYKIQTSAGAENPTWTLTGGLNDGGATMATFK